MTAEEGEKSNTTACRGGDSSLRPVVFFTVPAQCCAVKADSAAFKGTKRVIFLPKVFLFCWILVLGVLCFWFDLECFYFDFSVVFYFC